MDGIEMINGNKILKKTKLYKEAAEMSKEEVIAMLEKTSGIEAKMNAKRKAFEEAKEHIRKRDEAKEKLDHAIKNTNDDNELRMAFQEYKQVMGRSE